MDPLPAVLLPLQLAQVNWFYHWVLLLTSITIFKEFVFVWISLKKAIFSLICLTEIAAGINLGLLSDITPQKTGQNGLNSRHPTRSPTCERAAGEKKFSISEIWPKPGLKHPAPAWMATILKVSQQRWYFVVRLYFLSLIGAGASVILRTWN